MSSAIALFGLVTTTSYEQRRSRRRARGRRPWPAPGALPSIPDCAARSATNAGSASIRSARAAGRAGHRWLEAKPDCRHGPGPSANRACGRLLARSDHACAGPGHLSSSRADGASVTVRCDRGAARLALALRALRVPAAAAERRIRAVDRKRGEDQRRPRGRARGRRPRSPRASMPRRRRPSSRERAACGFGHDRGAAA